MYSRLSSYSQKMRRRQGFQKLFRIDTFNRIAKEVPRRCEKVPLVVALTVLLSVALAVPLAVPCTSSIN